jgi:hypothetical protein
MLSELLIAALVLALGGYWFRYNCLSILKTKTSRNRAQQVASANQLAFPEVEARLKEDVGTAEMQSLNQALLRDYGVLKALLSYTANAYTVEQRMLMLDFRFMQLRYAFTRRHIRRHARKSLGECARILNHFANTIGERSAVVTRA